MTWYQSISELQEPHGLLGLDPTGRAQCSFNILAVKASSDTFIEELVKKLETAGVGTRGVNIFATAKATIPDGSGPYLGIAETPGMPAIKIADTPGPKYPRPGALIVVHAESYSAARTMARAAYEALVRVRNVDLPT